MQDANAAIVKEANLKHKTMIYSGGEQNYSLLGQILIYSVMVKFDRIYLRPTNEPICCVFLCCFLLLYVFLVFLGFILCFC